MTVTLEQAKAELDSLVQRAVDGEEVVISRGDGPSLRLIVEAAGPKETQVERIQPGSIGTWLGCLTHQGTVPDNFDTMFQAEIEEMFYGHPEKFADVEKHLADHPGYTLASLDLYRTEQDEPGGVSPDHESAA